MLGTFCCLPTMQVHVTQGKDHNKPRGKVSSQGQCAHKSEGTAPGKRARVASGVSGGKQKGPEQGCDTTERRSPGKRPSRWRLVSSAHGHAATSAGLCSRARDVTWAASGLDSRKKDQKRGEILWLKNITPLITGILFFHLIYIFRAAHKAQISVLHSWGSSVNKADTHPPV